MVWRRYRRPREAGDGAGTEGVEEGEGQYGEEEADRHLLVVGAVSTEWGREAALNTDVLHRCIVCEIILSSFFLVSFPSRMVSFVLHLFSNR